MADGPLVENEIWRYYQIERPGQVQVLGLDTGNGSQAQLQQFRTNAQNPTFPLLRTCQDQLPYYGERDNYVVIDKHGIIRYHAYDYWPYANRYHRDELRAKIDTAAIVGVDDGIAERAYLLNAIPNPFHDVTTLELANPSGRPLDARVTIHDLAGRRIATVWSGRATQGTTRVSWGGRADDGTAVAPGVYTVRAQVGSVSLVRRIVHLR